MSWIRWEFPRKKDDELFRSIVQRQLSIRATTQFHICIQRARLESLALSTKTEVLSCHVGGIASLALEKQEFRYLLSGGVDGAIAMYDLESQENGHISASSSSHANSIRHLHSISNVEWYPEDSGAFVSSSLDGRLLIWDTEAFEVAGEFTMGNNVRIYNSCCRSQSSGAGAIIACGLSDTTIRLCDTTTGDSCHVLHGHKAAVTGVQWCPNNLHQLASCSMDGAIKIWDVRKGGTGGSLMSFDWLEDHTSTARGLFSKQPVRIGINGNNGSISGSRLTPPGLYKTDWKKDGAARAHEGKVMSLQYTPCGNFLLSAGNEGKVRLWAADSGALQPVNYRLSPPKSALPWSMCIAKCSSSSGDDLLFCPDDKNGDIVGVPVHSPSGRPLVRLKGHLGAVTSLVYREPLQQIISGSRDGMVFVWDAKQKESYLQPRVGTGSLHIQVRSEQLRDGPVDVEIDAWSEDEDAEAEAERKVSPRRKCFVPPIISQYLDEAARIARSKITSSSNASALLTAAVVASGKEEAKLKIKAATGALRIKYGSNKTKKARGL